MLRPAECVALCHCGYNWIAAFEQHHISTTRSEGQRLKYTKNSVCHDDDSSTSALKMCFAFVHDAKTHSAMWVASCPVLEQFIIFSFSIFPFLKWAFFTSFFNRLLHFLLFLCFFCFRGDRMRHYSQLSKKCSLVTLKCSNAFIKLSNKFIINSFGHLYWLIDFIYSTPSPSNTDLPSVKYFCFFVLGLWWRHKLYHC